MRWDPYVINSAGKFDTFWQEHLTHEKRSMLVIVGRGFDPRAIEVPQRLCEIGGSRVGHIWMLAFDNGLPDSPTRIRLTECNVEGYRKLFGEHAITDLPVRIGGASTRTFTSMNTKKAINRRDELKRYTDVVVDISAMPRMVALTVIAQLTALLDDIWILDEIDVNLHVVVAESVTADRRSVGSSLSENVTYVAGFSGHLDAQATDYLPRVWLPILGEGQSARLDLIRQEVNPNEICPVVPFPSREPRRGDLIVEEYRQLLFEGFEVEPGNIIHASEYNPFEAYRQLYGAIDRYRDALRELDGCKVFVSPLSSKLLSVGALLACYDHAKPLAKQSGRLYVGMPYVESASYSDPVSGGADGRELHSMWIRGEWER